MQPDWFPWLSLLIFLPLAGAGALYLAPERHARTIALATTVLDVLVALPLWWLFDPSSSRMQFVEHVAWITSPPIHYSLGIDGISLPLDPDDRRTDAPLHPGVLGVHHHESADLHGRPARDGDRHARRLRRAGLCAVLCLLGSDADPDVPAHRRLGRAQPPVRGHQVLPLHLGRQRAPLGRHPRAVLLWRAHVRCAGAQSGDVPRSPAAMAVSGILRRLCSEGPDVPVPHLAARRACRSTDGRQRDPRQRAAEDGHLWVRALQSADAAGRRVRP